MKKERFPLSPKDLCVTNYLAMISILAGRTLELWGGCECTINRVGGRFHSQFAHRSRTDRLADIERIAGLGIRTIRFPLLWEELAPNAPGEIDWTFPDIQMERLQALGLRPIIGLVHHGSGPRYTSLIDPRFPGLLADYARAVAERYPWAEAFTPVNEPLTTARFSGLYGLWFPHGRSAGVFARALLNQVRGVAAAMQAIRAVNPAAQLVQTEDLGCTLSAPALAYQAEFENERRWLSFDLLCGRLDPESPVWTYLRKAGIEEDELLRVLAQPCSPDLLGINHYLTSARFLDEEITRYAAHEIGGNGRDIYADVAAVRAAAGGFCEPRDLLREAWERFRIPLAVTEAHLCCTREEQMRWLLEMWDAAQALRSEQVPVTAVTAWSICGAYDWNSLLTRPDGHYEPGAFDLRSPQPRETAVTSCLRELATHGASTHPLLRGPGWWRRRARLIGDETVHAAPLRVFAPRANRGMPMLLITGATGMLGQAFARMCRLRGLPYRLLSRSEMDIADPDAVRSTIAAFRPWAVVNAAGYARVEEAENDEDRCFRENTVGPQVLAGACATADVPLLIFSSSLVFNGAKNAAYVESDLPTPMNAYGRSKAAAEAQVLTSCPRALVVRTSAFFGPWDDSNFITQTINRLAAGKTVTAAEDVRLSPTYVPDLVHGALDLLIDRETGGWHLANAGAVSWAELARTAARIAGFDPALVHGVTLAELNLLAPRPLWSALGSERGQLLSGWEGALHRYFQDRATGRPMSPREPAAATEHL
ncbi:MAG: dTDP-4-dehydrorhamnose reductase [Chthoniobacteraceae bacterium]|nr:dTDP-4-dehydrorhamnose reductase [Chthoniobacteraceae bacterium]